MDPFSQILNEYNAVIKRNKELFFRNFKRRFLYMLEQFCCLQVALFKTNYVNCGNTNQIDCYGHINTVMLTIPNKMAAFKQVVYIRVSKDLGRLFLIVC